MNTCEKRAWWVITIAIALIVPFLFNVVFKSIYQYVNPIGIEIVPNAQIPHEEKANYLLSLLSWDQKLIPVLMYATFIVALLALIIGLFFARNLYLKVGLLIISLISFGLAYYHYYIREHIAPIIQRLESQQD